MQRRKYLATISTTVSGVALAGCSSESDGGDGGSDGGDSGSDGGDSGSTSDPSSQLEIFGQLSGDKLSDGILAADIGIENPTDQSVTAEFVASMTVADNRGELTSEPIQKTIPSKEAPNITPVFLDNVINDWGKSTGVVFYGGNLQISVNEEPKNLSCFDSGGEDYESTSEGCEYYGTYSTHVEVEYSGNWEGAMGSGGSTRTVSRSNSTFGAPQGEDTSYVPIDDGANIVSANAQKQDDSSEELTIRIVDGREVIAEQSTSSGYGVAQVSESL